MRLLVALTLTLSLAGSVAVSAQGKGKGKGQQGKPDEARSTVVFSDPHRDAARSWFVNQYGRGNCPPGLAKKNNGCLPPGQAKKRYVVGQPLPSGIAVAELPRELSLRLGSAPAGYRYGILDGDVVILAIPTRLVIDAIDALVR